jgi:hypothetical protein
VGSVTAGQDGSFLTTVLIPNQEEIRQQLGSNLSVEAIEVVAVTETGDLASAPRAVFTFSLAQDSQPTAVDLPATGSLPPEGAGMDVAFRLIYLAAALSIALGMAGLTFRWLKR